MNNTQPSSRYPEKPNFLVFLVDEERYPPVYENAEIRDWRRQNLITQQLLKSHGLEFHRHHIGSTACCPSRATLLTGQYPSLHGVSQTTGIAKEPFDSDMFWLDQNTVPTMGDYFRAAGYQTYYKGKWHISYEDIMIPGTHMGLSSYNPLTGVPDEKKEELYYHANRLDSFGFSGWIGPEPHGKNPRNSGSSAAIGLSGRDEVYAAEVVELIESLNHENIHNKNAKPWLIVASFVNPHDIVLYGALTVHLPTFRFEVEPMPDVPPPPSINEPLLTKPRCQTSYRDIYPKALQPIFNQSFYRKLYYQLQKNADRQMFKVFKALTRSSFYDNTIVIFTSDHGDLLGAHGNLHQKWYCAYEEVLHVPFLIHNQQLFPQHKHFHALTSHVDLLPTMLGLANVDIEVIKDRLQSKFSEIRPFVGRDLTPFILGKNQITIANEPIYFMTDDDVTRGQHQINPLGEPYPSVIQPNHVESVITPLHRDGKRELWKLSRYFDNVQFWSHPGIKDETSQPIWGPAFEQEPHWMTQVKTKPEHDEYELYNLTDDPLETCNLALHSFATQHTRSIQAWMMHILEEQRKQKRLYPIQLNK
ncbi:sulfatase-like hydrolase/transferase [Aneurinibacillus aneurinilyticus]|jgi:arylsulfatase A-like enzyme|uniref:sulfatase-like hydrolase/transferase n=1 Tax=Aneurinibacillus aneurinilyticus TaxID=1391 RepID=UPI0023F9C93A|nr:sulfatase-like hydrolase/transferase [Aneurinibacillus aneurinilyticus]MCI1693381.1 sulfatase-like hydrolase/transferase [Aneurinibacillus aneurinilyticus]